MDYEQITYEVADKIVTITLSRPDRLNAFTVQMMEELLDAFDRADADDDVRVVIVTGAGRAFCAGADLERRSGTFDYGGPERVHRDAGGRITLRIFESPKPFIAAINGAAVGVGITMTLAMDVRLASTQSKMGFVFARRGIVLEAASSWFLPRAVGISRAMEWAATGRVFPAAEALAGGLVRSLHEPDELMPAAHALAREIADNTSAISVALNRQLLWRMLDADHPMEAHKEESRLLHYLGRTPDAKEGVESFLEKRAPSFPGRVSRDLPGWYPWWPDRPFQ